MRLDHLLSKEHLPAKAGKEPALSECDGGVLNGGDTGELLIGNGRPSRVSSSFGSAESDHGAVRLIGSVKHPVGS
ncbi:hypothetical protein Val02_93410 [Virgisporangium aliadipatigenens]|uniref:Uncharacterized protein n=1 Tax=Virgisporangium aliadipatigenens TaxID=741659 RepID=A0A8J3YZ88_9ACTN|nr:hypothetical protein Val02_93410 [Virgisporangium aliadipatigenens]